MKKWYVIGLLMLWAWSLQAAQAVSKIIVDASRAEFTIALPSNPTTGYQWTVKEYNTALFLLKTSQYVAPRMRLMGAGGTMVFTFQLLPNATYPETTQMLFQYARSFEPSSAQLQLVTIQFKNRKNST